MLVALSVGRIYVLLVALAAAYLLWSATFERGRKHAVWILGRIRRTSHRSNSAAAQPHVQPRDAAVEEPVDQDTSDDTAGAVPYQPRFLMGRLLPGSLTAWIDPNEHCLLIRAGVAAAAPMDPEPKLGSSEQTIFEDAMVSSSLEAWCSGVAFSARSGCPTWEPIDPTESRVVTLQRASTEMMPGGWSVEARSAITTRPGIGAGGPQGWVLLHAGVVIRADQSNPESRPLSLSDFHDTLWVLTTTLVAEVGPMILPVVCGRSDAVFSFECIVLPQQDLLGRYVELERSNWRRVVGMRDASGGDFNPSSLAAVQDPSERITTTRSWVNEILRNSGSSFHEADVSLLDPPRLEMRN